MDPRQTYHCQPLPLEPASTDLTERERIALVDGHAARVLRECPEEVRREMEQPRYRVRRDGQTRRRVAVYLRDVGPGSFRTIREALSLSGGTLTRTLRHWWFARPHFRSGHWHLTAAGLEGLNQDEGG